jgi:hypothetical protein
MNKKFISGVVLAAGLLFSASTIPYNAEAASVSMMGKLQLLKSKSVK